MAMPQTAYQCDHCQRVAARVNERGELLVRHRHGGEWHETIIVIKGQPVARRLTRSHTKRKSDTEE